MKKIIFALAVVFFISDCNADARVLAEILAARSARAKSSVSRSKLLKKTAKAKKNTAKSKRSKKIIGAKCSVLKDIKPKDRVTKEDLDIRNNIAYLPNEDKPFTGKYEEYHSNGKKYIEINYKDGKRNGSLIMWDENEHKIGKLNYRDGDQSD
ncbi:MAG: hypothetical protein EPN17_07650 [Methylobacter sp.]|nr:MAG: hypothetical protein EPN17_07650 [Methylobacter sp.]